MKKTLKLILILLLLSISISSAYGADYYVSTSGLDTNDCLTLPTSCLTIQGAINKAPEGSAVFIANGLYIASNTIINKALTIQGESKAGVIIAPAANDGQAGTVTYDGTSQQGLIVVANDVAIKDLTIDGDANNLANGGTLINQHNFRTGILNTGSTLPGPYNNLVVQNVVIRNIVRRGINLFPATSSGHVVSNSLIENIDSQQGIYSAAAPVTITGNTIRGAGMGIGLYPGLGASSGKVLTVTGNTIYDIAGSYSLYYGHSYPSIGIYYRNPDYDQKIIITGNHLTIGNGEEIDMPGVLGMYVYNADASSQIADNTIDAISGTNNFGIYLGGCAGTTVENNVFTMNELDSGIYLGRGDAGIPVPNIISDNTFTSSGSTSTDISEGSAILQSNDGGVFWMAEIPYNTDSTINGNSINGFVRGIALNEAASGVYVQPGTTVKATINNNNNIYENSLFGIDASTLSVSVDASGNWWGHYSGPYHATNTAGTGNAVSNNVNFKEWLCDPATSTFLTVNGKCDADSDTYAKLNYGGNDCNDNKAEIYPGAIEECDGIDNDCNPSTADGSGAIAPLNTNQNGVCLNSKKICAGAWADGYSSIPNYENQESICDGLDNDCDNSVDESLTNVLCDLQQGVCLSKTKICGGSNGWLTCDASTYGVNYEATTETTCGDGLDNDCDGKIDCIDEDCAGKTGPGAVTCCQTSVECAPFNTECSNPICTNNNCARQNEPDTTICRATNGLCDNAEYCTGASAYCPVDSFLSALTVCRAATEACDIDETCTGLSAACPIDAFKPAATLCRAKAGICDIDETCTGSSAACPSDAKSTIQCRPSAGLCDIAENCDGINNACPSDAKSTAQCRPSAGLCDIAANCDGINNRCPANALKSNEQICRIAVGECDVDEKCTGLSAQCKKDIKKPVGELCGQARDCNADSCVGNKAYFYSLDGHDYCDASGTCLQYQCILKSSSCADNNLTDGVNNALGCNALCDQNSDCPVKECDDLDGCYSGTYRDYQDVNNACTGSCNCEQSACNIYTNKITDKDRDGYDAECDNDCDDNNKNVNPGAKEFCGNNIDEDCNGAKAVCDLVIHSPDPMNYSSRYVPFNISLTGEFKYLKYADLLATTPRNSTLCTKCNSYGLDALKLKSFSDGYYNLEFYGVQNWETFNKTVAFFVDSTKPRIIRQEPENKKYCNGEFTVQYNEKFPKKVYLHYADKEATNETCPGGNNQKCSISVALADHENETITYYFEVEDSFWRIPFNQEYTCMVDTIPPHLDSINSNLEGRYLYLNISLDSKAKYIKYTDAASSTQRETTLCSNCIEYGASRVKKIVMARGQHNLTIIAEDNAGNRDTSDPIVFTV